MAKIKQTIKLGIVIDPLESINTKKDSTYAMIREACTRNWQIYCFQAKDIYVKRSLPHAMASLIQFNHSTKNTSNWYNILSTEEVYLDNLDIILLRKDPPFNLEYIYTTYLLDQLKNCLVANNPTSVRNNNEKLATLKYPELTPPNIVTANKQKLLEFLKEHKTIIVKPLDGMGGRSIFKIEDQEANTHVILDTITDYGNNVILAQKYIPEIMQGDKRVLLVNGQPIPYGLARIPAHGEFRGNLAAGASGVGFKLTNTEYKICEQLGPDLKQQGLYFVGIDIIGEYLTEINVTSPTCIQELDKQFDLNISKTYLDCLEQKLP
jgi:glutathione synthase